jgi:hypothetical protein
LKPTEAEYKRVLEKNPTLCVQGMSDRAQKNFQANRKSLEVSYDSFLICCDWISKLTLKERAEVSSRHSIELKHRIESQYGQFIPHGSVLAAAIFLGVELCPDECKPRNIRPFNAN